MTKNKRTSKEICKDIKQDIINQVIKLIEVNEKLPWVKPWYMPATRNLMGKDIYHGVNAWITSLAPSPFFLTKHFAKSIDMIPIDPNNILVYPIVHYTPIFYLNNKKVNEKEYKQLSKDNQKNCKVCRSLQYYQLQCIADFKLESIPEIIKKRLHKFDNKKYNPKINEAEAIINKNNPIIRLSGRAYYRPKDDYIGIPDISNFDNSEAYYTTMFHEMAHWSGAKQRLNRIGITNIDLFNEHRYSIEELIAEFTASQLSYNLGIESHIDNSTAYIAGWVSKLKNDPDMLFSASKISEKVIDYLTGGVK